MTRIASVILEAHDPAAAEEFYAAAFGLGDRLQVRGTETPTSGFRGYILSLVVAQPGNVDALMDAATRHGATTLKAAQKSFWGYGGVLQAPDGAIWKIASSAKKDSGPATREINDFVLLLGVADVKATKQFYAERGMTVAKSFGSKYVEFDSAGSPVKLALYSRRAAAKDAGVAADGTGSHRLAIAGDGTPITDPDGFAWETATTGAGRVASRPS
jgi:predicted lactoylglutathione lyase